MEKVHRKGWRASPGRGTDGCLKLGQRPYEGRLASARELPESILRVPASCDASVLSAFTPCDTPKIPHTDINVPISLKIDKDTNLKSENSASQASWS